MAVAQGYGKIVISGSVFAYDVGDTRNSYIGEPTVNLLYSAGATNLINGAGDIYQNCTKTDLGNGKFRFVNDGTGGSTVRVYANQGDLTNGATYACSIYFEDLIGSISIDWCDTGITGTNYSTNSSGRLGGYGTRGTYDGPYYFLDINLNSGGAVTLYDPQVELKSHVTPFIAGTRSATQGLLDLTGNNTIDLSNVSFDSNAQMTFDGTDDNIYPNIIINGTGLTSITAEFLVKSNGNNKNIIKSNSNGIILHYGGAGFYLNSTDSTTSGYLGWNGKLTGGSGVHEHLVATWDGTTMKLYVNGEPTGTTLAYSGGSTGILKDLTNVVIGSSFNSSQPWFNGTVPVTKIYNRALTAAEVNQNYRHYKTRFNLS